jgi:DNA polymerase I-like protein with 3'-5' exonuclease and polymerase domains
MTFADLCTTLQSAGVCVGPGKQPGKLRLQAPRGVLTATLLAAVQSHKADLLTMLAGGAMDLPSVHVPSEVVPVASPPLPAPSGTAEAAALSTDRQATAATPQQVIIGDKRFFYKLRWAGEVLSPADAYLAFDTETNLVDLKSEIPCLALASASASNIHSCLIHPDDVGAFILAHQHLHLVCHNAAFDFWVVEKHLRDSGQDFALQAWWQMADENRLHDSMLLDALVRLARNDTYPELRNLAEVSREYAHLVISKDDPYRMRYAEIIARDWRTVDIGFFEYAVKDAIATRLAYRALRQEADALMARFGSVGVEIRADAVERHGLLTEAVQVKKAIALAQITRNGMHVDIQAVRSQEVQLREELMAATQAAQAVCPIYKTDANGQFILSGKCRAPAFDDRALRNALLEIRPWIESQLGIALDIPIGKSGISRAAEYWIEHAPLHPFLQHWVQAQSLAKLVQFFAQFQDHADLGQLAAVFGKSAGDLAVAIGLHPKGVAAAVFPAEDVLARVRKHGDKLATIGIDPQQCIDQVRAQAQASRPERLVVHPSYRILVRTGRTSCSSPNIQQIPRKDQFRRVFVAPPGHFLLTADYSFIELRTPAATTLHRYGHSRMAEIIRSGVDPHAYTASMVLGMSLEEFMTWKNNETLISPQPDDGQGPPVRLKDRFAEARQAAKAVNFGVPGGLGAARLVDYARSNYHVEFSLEEAQAQRDRLTKEIYPELDTYLAEDGVALLARNLYAPVDLVRRQLGDIHVSSIYRVLVGDARRQDGKPYHGGFVNRIWAALSRANRNAELREPIANRRCSLELAAKVCHAGVATLTGRIRGRVQYSQARNTPFQGLAADGAALALFDLVREGFVVTAFVHDEIHALLPDEGGYVSTAKVERFQEVICRRMEEVLGGVLPVACEAALSERWAKQANLIVHGDRVYPWQPEVTSG